MAYELPLKAYAKETLTVSDTAVGITASLFLDSNSQPLPITRAIIAYISGGDFYHTSVGTPLDDGSDGSIPEFAANKPKFILTGASDIKNWKGIKANGASDVSLSITLEGP